MFWSDGCLVKFHFTRIGPIKLNISNRPCFFTACIAFDEDIFAAFEFEGFLVPSFKVVVVGDFIVDEFNAIRGDCKDDRYIKGIKDIVLNGDVFVVILLLIIEIAYLRIDGDDGVGELEA